MMRIVIAELLRLLAFCFGKLSGAALQIAYALRRAAGTIEGA